MALPGRTTAVLIRAINKDLDEDTDLDPFIDAANELVTEVCGAVGYSNDRLTLIETWLAAHFAAVDDAKMTSVGAGPVAVRFEGHSGLALDFTRYGQQAKLLDTKGGLAALDSKMKKGGGKVQLMWLGTPLDEEIEE